MDVVVKAYDQILQKKVLDSQQALKHEDMIAQKDHNSKLAIERAKMEKDKESIRMKLGADLFDDIYSFLIYHRSQSSTDE